MPPYFNVLYSILAQNTTIFSHHMEIKSDLSVLMNENDISKNNVFKNEWTFIHFSVIAFYETTHVQAIHFT